MSRLLAAATAVLGLLLLTASASAVPDMALHGRVIVNKMGSGNGTVVSSPPGIDCGDTCSFLFVSNDDPENYEPVTLTATPDPGSEFEGFEGCCPIEVAPSKAYGVTAFFGRLRPTTFSLAVTVSGSGAVTSQPGGIALRSDVHGVLLHGYHGRARGEADARLVVCGLVGGLHGHGAVLHRHEQPEDGDRDVRTAGHRVRDVRGDRGRDRDERCARCVCGEACVASFGAGSR